MGFIGGSSVMQRVAQDIAERAENQVDERPGDDAGEKGDAQKQHGHSFSR
jgi:hypothetical protein